MTDRQTRVVSTREEAHEAIMQGYLHAKALLADGKRVQISVGEDADPITLKQRRFLHGPVLSQIAEQVRVGGERYVMEVWKEYFRKLFLADRFEMHKVPRYDKTLCQLVNPKRATPIRVRVSSEDLGIKKYSEYIDKIIAYAATEWSVAFKFDPLERDSVRYVRVGKMKVDADTGEILEAAC